MGNFSRISAEIINKNTGNRTIEIRIQGGINAANGIQTNFKVYPVQKVTGIRKPKREKSGSGQKNPQTAKAPVFSTILEKAVQENTPAECYTVTYDRQSRLQTYYYCQSREYTR